MTTTTTTSDRFLEAICAGAGVPEELFAPGAELDATVPGWRLAVRGAAAVAAQYSQWFADPAGFEELIVADLKGGPVRIRDIATVLDGEEEPRTLSRLNGRNAVSLVIRKQSGTNTVEVVDRLKAKLAEAMGKFNPDRTVLPVPVSVANTPRRALCCRSSSRSLPVTVEACA